jgi:hypothetical protein
MMERAQSGNHSLMEDTIASPVLESTDHFSLTIYLFPMSEEYG